MSSLTRSGVTMIGAGSNRSVVCPESGARGCSVNTVEKDETLHPSEPSSASDSEYRRHGYFLSSVPFNCLRLLSLELWLSFISVFLPLVNLI